MIYTQYLMKDQLWMNLYQSGQIFKDVFLSGCPRTAMPCLLQIQQIWLPAEMKLNNNDQYVHCRRDVWVWWKEHHCWEKIIIYHLTNLRVISNNAI